MIDKKEIFLQTLKRWVNNQVSDITGNNLLFTPIAQKYVGNTLDKYSYLIDGFFKSNGEFDSEMMDSLLVPFNSNYKNEFDILGQKIKIENGLISFNVLGKTYGIDKKDIEELLNMVKSNMDNKITT